MAYSTMTTRSAGYVVPASEWNQLIANDEACAVAGFTTAGDLFYGTGSKAGSRLAIGAANKTLMVNSGATAPEWGVARRILKQVGYSLVSNDNTEKTIATVSIPANTLAVAGLYYWLDIFPYNDTGGNVNFTVTAHYATLTRTQTVVIADNNTNYQQIVLEAWCHQSTATNAQNMWGRYYEKDDAGANNGGNGLLPTAGAIDSTSAQTAKLTVQMGTANANAKFIVGLAMIGVDTFI